MGLAVSKPQNVQIFGVSGLKANEVQQYVDLPFNFKSQIVVLMLGGNDVSYHWLKNKQQRSPLSAALEIGSIALLFEKEGFQVYVAEVLYRTCSLMAILQLNVFFLYLFEDRFISLHQKFNPENFIDNVHLTTINYCNMFYLLYSKLD